VRNLILRRKMLIKSQILARIKNGDVSLAFRRWKKPTVRSGGTLQTAIGVLNIENIENIKLKAITEADAIQAGYTGLNTLIQELDNRQGDVFKITLAYAGEDPRIKLRENSELSSEDLLELQQKLKRLDARSVVGDWTCQMLMNISTYPMLSAGELAKLTVYKKVWLKTNVRKLKNLGLTISIRRAIPGRENRLGASGTFKPMPGLFLLCLSTALQRSNRSHLCLKCDATLDAVSLNRWFSRSIMAIQQGNDALVRVLRSFHLVMSIINGVRVV
jgi:hypothetical protein